jgi:hypothetical protein
VASRWLILGDLLLRLPVRDEIAAEVAILTRAPVTGPDVFVDGVPTERTAAELDGQDGGLLELGGRGLWQDSPGLSSRHRHRFGRWLRRRWPLRSQ